MAYGIDLKGKVALVTGGSREIGRATTERFAEAGAHVVINYLRDEMAAAEACKSAERFGVEALAVRADVAQKEDANQLVQACMERFGRLDYLICNAGLWEGAAVEQMSEELWERVISVNLRGTWAVCHASVPHMKRQGGGQIVIVSSTAGQRGEAFYSNYATALASCCPFLLQIPSSTLPLRPGVAQRQRQKQS